MSYFLAPSLVALRNEVNAKYPKRDKKSDGWIGDPSHQARKSDHNPDYADGGIVRAIDIDKDGINVQAVLAAVLSDPRVSYVIWNRRIWGGSRWRAYEGTNPHTGHIHVSIEHNAAGARAGSWGIATGAPAKPSKPKVSKQSKKNPPNGSTTFPTDYEDLETDGLDGALTYGAHQILMHAIGKRRNKQWDGKFAKLSVMDTMDWMQDLGYYDETPVAKWGAKKGTPLVNDGKDGKWFYYELQRLLKDRKLYSGVLDGDPKGMTVTSWQKYLNQNNGS